MKKYIFFSTIIFLSFAYFSCKKVPINIPDPVDPVPADTSTQRNFTITFGNLSNYQAVPDSLIVKATIENTQTNTGKINISIPVVFKQKYSTRSITLPKGSYEIKKLILLDSTGAAKFATPVTGSAKAASVNKPLNISFILDEKKEKTIEAELLLITNTDTPESFGYPAGSFGNHNPESEMDKLIYIRPIIKVGEVIYDSVPAQLIVKSWDDKNEMTYNIHYIGAGTQGVYLSAKGVKHQLSISKWGTYDEIILNKKDIQENAVYEIGGEVAAKKLKTEYEYKIVGGVSTPLTKTDFEYHADGKIKQRQVLGKRADMSNYVVQKDLFEYEYNRISTIKTYDEQHLLTKTMSIQYQDANGRISAMQEKSTTEEIKTTVSYTALETRSGLTQDYRIDAQHNYGQGLPVAYYSKTIYAGRVLTDVAVTEHGNREEGIYEYDACINPYVHLGIPDRKFRLYEKHNLSIQWKTWYAGYPENEAYAFSYTYDADGYPKELITKYRSYQTKKDTYSIKNVYLY